MAWEDLNKELRKIYPLKEISCDDALAIKAVHQTIKKIYPYLTDKGIEQIIEKACYELDKPCEREEFLQRLVQKMNEVPFRIMVNQRSRIKNEY